MKLKITKGGFVVEVEDASATDLIQLVEQIPATSPVPSPSPAQAPSAAVVANDAASASAVRATEQRPVATPQSVPEKWAALLADSRQEHIKILRALKEKGSVEAGELATATGCKSKQQMNGYIAKICRNARELGLDSNAVVHTTTVGYMPNRVVTYHAGDLLKASAV